MTAPITPTFEVHSPAPRTSVAAARRPWMLVRLVVIGLLTLLGVGMAAGTAGASVYAAGGATGRSAVGVAKCSNKAYNNQLLIEVPAPTIYAANYRAGYGNDSQYVRFRVAVVDARTGYRVYTSGYSAVAVAGDNVSARFGSTPIAVAPNGIYTVQVEIQWLNNTMTVVTGVAGHFIDYYKYYDVYNANQGTFDTCRKY